ncbi:hypothetical protein OOJ91_20450 [Micromonospora lupini]|uniref:hypothetical protein n=1 Tax=Micromonospora lupini TaxID=285679 RepID=UPI00225101A2|nr:hypothetical protein [Micromonospora lupini]MCX5068215.1 hypothetical protein [Micromonospora lupini]
MAATEEFTGLDAIYEAYGLESASDRSAVADAYAVFREHHGPYVTSIAAEMLDDLRASVDADPNTRVVFVGRDGFSLGVAVRAMDREFFDAHCHNVVLSRALAEAAVQDKEKNGGAEYPQLQPYREISKSIDDRDVDGAYQRLTRYLRGNGIPVGTEGSSVTFVDSCLKGTIQELCAAVYPKTEFTGRYMFYKGIEGDPHPGSKKGYALHIEGGIGGGLKALPDDPALTFASIPAIRVIENALQGPLSSPKRITDDAPDQTRLIDTPDRTWGCNPVLIAEPYRIPAVREASKVAGLLAVHDSAVDVGNGAPLDTAAVREQFTTQVRSWINRGDDVEPGLNRILDSFVHRDDHRLVRRLDDLMHEARLPEDTRTQFWTKFDEVTSMDDKKNFIEQFRNVTQRGPDVAGPRGENDPTHRRAETGQPWLRGIAPAAGGTVSQAPPQRARPPGSGAPGRTSGGTPHTGHPRRPDAPSR